MLDEIAEFYSKPQIGGSLPVFVGSRRHQVGGGFFGTLARFALPILKRFGGRALNVAARTVSDVVERQQPLKDAFISNAMQEVKTVLDRKRSDPPSSINKEGGGRRDIFSSKRRRL